MIQSLTGPAYAGTSGFLSILPETPPPTFQESECAIDLKNVSRDSGAIEIYKAALQIYSLRASGQIDEGQKSQALASLAQMVSDGSADHEILVASYIKAAEEEMSNKSQPVKDPQILVLENQTGIKARAKAIYENFIDILHTEAQPVVTEGMMREAPTGRADQRTHAYGLITTGAILMLLGIITTLTPTQNLKMDLSQYKRTELVAPSQVELRKITAPLMKKEGGGSSGTKAPKMAYKKPIVSPPKEVQPIVVQEPPINALVIPRELPKPRDVAPPKLVISTKSSGIKNLSVVTQISATMPTLASPGEGGGLGGGKGTGAGTGNGDGTGSVNGPGGHVGDTRGIIAVNTPDPEYTISARNSRIEGQVVLLCTIDQHGNVKSAQLNGEPLPLGLTENAIAKVKTWKFKPALRNGVPVEAIATITVNFRLN